jgi:hypothetical protein
LKSWRRPRSRAELAWARRVGAGSGVTFTAGGEAEDSINRITQQVAVRMTDRGHRLAARWTVERYLERPPQPSSVKREPCSRPECD